MIESTLLRAPVAATTRKVRMGRAGHEDLTLFVGHRRLKWTFTIWPILAILVFYASTFESSRLLSVAAIGFLAIPTFFWLQGNFGNDRINVRGGEISVSRGFGVLKRTTNFRVSDIECVAFYPASRSPRAEPESCIGIYARQWVPPLVFALGIEEGQAFDILQHMKLVPALSPKVQLDLKFGRSGRVGRV